MQFNLRHLLLVFPALFVGIFIAEDLGARRDVYRWRRVRSDLATLQTRLQEIAAREPDLKFDAETINLWINDAPPSNHQLLWRTIPLRPSRDPWGQFYQCVKVPAKAGQPREFGFYSMGFDLDTNSAGNDPDDLNSWDDAQFQRYREQEIKTERSGNVLLGICFSPFIYLFLAALVPLTRILLNDVGWRRKRREMMPIEIHFTPAGE